MSVTPDSTTRGGHLRLFLLPILSGLSAYLLRGTSPRLQLLCPLLGPHCPCISLTGCGALYGPGPLPFPLSISTGFWYFQSWVSAWPLTQRAFLAVTPLAEVVTRMK